MAEHSDPGPESPTVNGHLSPTHATQIEPQTEVSEPPPKNYGASLMVFAVDPTHGLPWVLLAREVSSKWCGGGCAFTDFGGGADASDADAEDTAAREFYEESLFCIDVPGISGPFNTRQRQLANQLRNGDYLFRVNFPVRNKHATYSMFIKQVSWHDDMNRFRNMRRKLLNLRYCRNLSEQDRAFIDTHPAFYMVKGRPSLHRRYLEKINIEPFSITGLRRFLKHGQHNLLKDMTMKPFMRGNVRTACDLIESMYDSTEGSAQVRSNTVDATAYFPSSRKKLPTNTDSSGKDHIGLCKQKYTLRVFATEPHANTFAANDWDRTDYHSDNRRPTSCRSFCIDRPCEHWSYHFQKKTKAKQRPYFYKLTTSI